MQCVWAIYTSFKEESISFYKITEIVRSFWLVINLSFSIPVNTEKVIQTQNRPFNWKQRFWKSLNPLSLIKSVGLHILLLFLTIHYRHSFKSYEVQSWKAIYISRRCEIAQIHVKNNCINFRCRKLRENITIYQPAMKPIVLAFLNYFCVKIKFLNEGIVLVENWQLQ